MASASYKDPLNVHLVEANQPPVGDLMIIECPCNNPNIGAYGWGGVDQPSLERMNLWVARWVHVVGKDDWVFVKLHSHGCMGDIAGPLLWDCYFGAGVDQFYGDVEQCFNDGVDWKLHYVSAREMYNIIKAAEAGMTGDPGAYRDFIIPPYANTVILTVNPYRLLTYDASQVVVELIDTSTPLDMSLKAFRVDAIVLESNNVAGPWQSSDAVYDNGRFGELHLWDGTPSHYYWVRSPTEP